ncbi:MAG: LysR family transcriptional regulator [Burkholderiales bacterium]
MTLGLRDIEYFVAVADHGNVGRAAVALGLSQPALSKSLRRLEASMQTKLVKKIPQGIELTTVGKAFLSHVRRIRLSLDDVTREVTDLTQGRAGNLRIGCGPDMVDLLVQRACQDLLKTSPKVTFSILIGINDALFPGLRAGAYDLTVSELPAGPDESLIQEYLLDDEFCVFASARHRTARQYRETTLAELARQQWAATTPSALGRARLVRAFEDSDLAPPKITLETNSPALILGMVASSDLLGFLSRRVVRSAGPKLRLAERRVKGKTWPRRVGVSYRKDAYLSPAAKRFIEILKATAKEISAEKR